MARDTSGGRGEALREVYDEQEWLVREHDVEPAPGVRVFLEGGGDQGARETPLPDHAPSPLITGEIPAILWTTDTQLRLTSAYGPGLHREPEDGAGYLGKSLYAWFGTLDPASPPIAAHLQALRGASGQYERRVGDRDYEVHVEPLRDAHNQITGCLALGIDVTERKQADEQLRRSAARAGALAEMSQALAEAGPDCQAALETIARCTAGAIGDCCIVTLLSDDGRWLRPVAHHHVNPEANASMGPVLLSAPYQVGEGPFGRVAETGLPVFIPVVQHETCRPETKAECYPYMDRFGIGSLLVMPLRVRGRVIGTLGVLRDTAGPPYTAEDALFLQDLASQAALAIDNARLFDLTRRRAAELEALVAVSSALREVTTRAQMLPLLVEKTAELSGADACALLLLEGDALVLSAGTGPVKALEGVECPRSDPLLGRLLHTGEPLFVPNAAEPGEAGRCEPVARVGPAFEASTVLPLRCGDEALGLLVLGYAAPHEFPEDERGILVALAEVAGNALYRASVVDTLEQRVADRTRELAVLYDVTAVASQSLDLSVVLDQALDRVLAAIGSPAGSIRLMDEADGTLHVVAHRGVPSETVDGAGCVSWTEALDSRVAESGEALIVRATPANAPVAEATQAGYVGTYHGLPMRAGGRTLGVLSVVTEGDRPFNVEEMALLASIADDLGVAVENAQLRRKTEEAAVFAERERLARELHDAATQSLYSLTLFAEAGRQWAAAGDAEQVVRYLARIGETAHQALREMRLLVYELRPPVLEEMGLVEAVRRRLNAVEGRAGVEARLVTEGAVELPAHSEGELYRIVQEALNNALKHAGASAVTVTLRAAGERLELEVADDGRGFSPDAPCARSGMGLTGMRERAERLGGTLTIESAPGEGTRVKVVM